MSKSDRKSQNSSAPAGSDQQKRDLFYRWERTAYRGARSPVAGFVSTNPRVDEFLAMVKQCECGKWHLEMGLKCRNCSSGKSK